MQFQVIVVNVDVEAAELPADPEQDHDRVLDLVPLHVAQGFDRPQELLARRLQSLEDGAAGDDLVLVAQTGVVDRTVFERPLPGWDTDPTVFPLDGGDGSLGDLARGSSDLSHSRTSPPF